MTRISDACRQRLQDRRQDRRGARSGRAAGRQRVRQASDVGGPLIPVDGSMIFDTQGQGTGRGARRARRAEEGSAAAIRSPIRPRDGRSPARSASATTRCSARRRCIRAWISARRSAANAMVTAPGVVVKAGWNGGYGRMVEVDHGNGFSTRYGHLSRIDVKVGEMSCAAASSARSAAAAARPARICTTKSATMAKPSIRCLPQGRQEGRQAAVDLQIFLGWW